MSLKYALAGANRGMDRFLDGAARGQAHAQAGIQSGVGQTMQMLRQQKTQEQSLAREGRDRDFQREMAASKPQKPKKHWRELQRSAFDKQKAFMLRDPIEKWDEEKQRVAEQRTRELMANERRYNPMGWDWSGADEYLGGQPTAGAAPTAPTAGAAGAAPTAPTAPPPGRPSPELLREMMDEIEGRDGLPSSLPPEAMTEGSPSEAASLNPGATFIKGLLGKAAAQLPPMSAEVSPIAKRNVADAFRQMRSLFGGQAEAPPPDMWEKLAPHVDSATQSPETADLLASLPAARDIPAPPKDLLGEVPLSRPPYEDVGGVTAGPAFPLRRHRPAPTITPRAQSKPFSMNLPRLTERNGRQVFERGLGGLAAPLPTQPEPTSTQTVDGMPPIAPPPRSPQAGLVDRTIGLSPPSPGSLGGSALSRSAHGFAPPGSGVTRTPDPMVRAGLVPPELVEFRGRYFTPDTAGALERAFGLVPEHMQGQLPDNILSGYRPRNDSDRSRLIEAGFDDEILGTSQDTVREQARPGRLVGNTSSPHNLKGHQAGGHVDLAVMQPGNPDYNADLARILLPLLQEEGFYRILDDEGRDRDPGHFSRR